MRYEDIEISVKNSAGDKMQLTIAPDTTIDEYIPYMFSIFKFLTFHEESIKEIFSEEI